MYERQRGNEESVYLDADDFADIADYYLNDDTPDYAMEALQMGLALHPDDEVLLSVLSATYIYMHEYDKAEEVLSGLDAEDSDVKYQLAQLEYAKYNRVAEAEKIWREWMEMENNKEASESFKRESYIHIISSLAELRNDHDDDGSDDTDVEAVRRWVQEYIDTFHPLGRYPEDVQVADICRDNNIPDLMAEVLTQVLEEQPYLPKGWSNLALAQFVQKKYPQALESCSFALAIDPDDLDALLTKAHSLNALKQKEEAVSAFKDYLEKGGEIIQAIPCAEVLFAIGERDQGFQMLKKVREQLEDALSDYKERYEKAKNKDGVEKERVDTLAYFYNNYVDLHQKMLSDISDLYHRNGYYQEGISVNERLVELDKNNAEAYFMLGINHLALSQYEEASKNFAFALKNAKDQVLMGIDIALTFVLNDFDQFALEVLDAVSQIAPSSKSKFVKNIPAAKSITYLKMGHKDQFLRYFREACQETPGLVQKVYDGCFPKQLPFEQWSDYASKNLDKLLKNFSKDTVHLQSLM